jgi:hypothetical protein
VSRYGRLRYGLGRYGGTSAPAPVLPTRQPSLLPLPGTRPLAVTGALRAAGPATPGAQPGAVAPGTRTVVLPRPGGRPSDTEV